MRNSVTVEEIASSSTPARAIVVGGGIAGLCAARVLSDFYAEVLLLERDRLPTSLEHRPGAPQDRHAHVLLGRGLRELDQLFPGFSDEMRARGAQEIDWQRDFATLQPAGWLRRNTLRSQLGLTLLMASRLLTESVVRARVRRLPNVRFVEDTVVTALRASRSTTLRITGVATRSSADGRSDDLAADLVVDASGRTSHAPQWLQELGLRVPQEIVVDSGIGYASRWYRRPSRSSQPPEWWWKGMWIEPVPPRLLIGGAMFPIENDQVLVTVAGLNLDRPPADEQGFNTFLRRFRTSLFADAVDHLEPVSKIYAYRQMPNRLRRYDTWNDAPRGFLAIGDSVCAFNPVYAQGMSVAAVEAATLHRCIEAGGPRADDLPARFFAAQSAEIGAPWAMATSADLSYPDTRGDRPFIAHLMKRYFAAYLAAAFDDPALNLIFEEVSQLLRPPTALLEPRVIARVLGGCLKPTVRRRRDDAEELPSPQLAFGAFVPRARHEQLDPELVGRRNPSST
jgi:2-polyprenyl-6-methoxyphenol hydroxylase-like FAD-dependent oxidoreductase